MKADCRLHVRQRGVVGVAFADHDAVETERIGDIPVGVLLDDDLAGRHSGASSFFPAVALIHGIILFQRASPRQRDLPVASQVPSRTTPSEPSARTDGMAGFNFPPGPKR